MVADIGAVLGQAQAGRVVVLATATSKRLPVLPQVPTTTEAGLPNIVAVNVYGLFAPAGTPRDLVARLNALAVEAMQAPEVRENIAKVGMQAETSSPEAFETYLREQTQKWAPLAKASGVRLN
ncbi:hypothetical protein LRS07_17440 [Aquabacterium sp. J223]|nr:tripartite tricarboxylate transporter substrate-binding protein [Aquabacterium sp. J223]UUX95009.1 hypothetical protein LRS07_17440 [Aquabacterium sp. J223]